MRRILLITLCILLLIALLLWGYLSQYKYRALELPEETIDTVQYKVSPSVFRLPITYHLNSLESFLNGKIQGKFLETQLSPTGNEKDQVQLEMQKKGSIKISAQGQQLVIRFPLQAKATIVQSRLQFITRGIKPVETQVNLTLKTPVSLDKDWKLITDFVLSEIKWVQPPVVKIAGISFDLTQKVDELIHKQKDKLTELLDKEINKAVSLKKPVQKIWEDLQKPLIIAEKPSRVYIRFVCENIGASIRISPQQLICNTTVQTYVAMLNRSDIKIPVKPLPAFRNVPMQSKFSDVYVYGFVGFDSINRNIQNAIQGKQIAAKGISTTIQQVRVYATDSGMAVHATLKGDIGGEMVATGTPRFDSVSQQFRLDNFRFRVASSSVLLNAGESFLHDKIQDTLQKQLIVGLAEQINLVPQLIENAIGKGKTGRTIDLDLEDFAIKSCDVYMGARRIQLVVHATFAGSIRLKSLKSGKTIKIKPPKNRG